MKTKRVRQKNIKKRWGLLTSFLITTLLWIAVSGIVIFIDPYTDWSIIVFFISLFLALLFTFSLLFQNSRRGLVVSSSLVLFLILRFFGIGNIINLLLLIGLATAVEVFFRKSNY